MSVLRRLRYSDSAVFFQFLSVYNHASAQQQQSVQNAAEEFFGSNSDAFQCGYLSIAAHMRAFQIGQVPYLQTLSITDLLGYYAKLNELDELLTYSEQAHGLGEWIVEKGGKLVGAVGRLAGKALQGLGWILDLSDFIGDKQREAVRLEITRRMDAYPDDLINYDWVQAYLRNKYGEDLPI